MRFICKIVKDCVHSDGIRDYIFLDNANFDLKALLQLIHFEQKFESTSFTEKLLADQQYIRLKCKYMNLFGFLYAPKVRVEFQDFHPTQLRDQLELLFDNF